MNPFADFSYFGLLLYLRHPDDPARAALAGPMPAGLFFVTAAMTALQFYSLYPPLEARPGLFVREIWFVLGYAVYQWAAGAGASANDIAAGVLDRAHSRHPSARHRQVSAAIFAAEQLRVLRHLLRFFPRAGRHLQHPGSRGQSVPPLTLLRVSLFLPDGFLRADRSLPPVLPGLAAPDAVASEFLNDLDHAVSGSSAASSTNSSSRRCIDKHLAGSLAATGGGLDR